jgi:2-dehydro-3-deoxygalactonokinase
MTSASAAHSIAVDWGTSSFRACLIGPDGAIADRVETGDGILSVPPGGFPAVLARTVGAWAAQRPGMPVIACGMVGSRQGWREAPYAPCPAGLDDLVAAIVEVEAQPPFGAVRLVPGVMRDDAPGPAAGGVPDVMRGEETQLMGAAATVADGVFVLPGTHSKWAVLHGGKIAWFATFMTGELFAVLSRHSILGRLMTPDGESADAEIDAGADADAAFDRGVADGLAAPGPERGGMIRRLFGVRTLPLFGWLPAAGVRPYLSGLLIGGEIAEARQCLHLKDRALMTAASTLTVIGAAGIAARYERALAAAGIAVRRGPDDAAARGLVRLAAAANERALRP